MRARAFRTCGHRSARNRAGNAASRPRTFGSPRNSPPSAPTAVLEVHAAYRTSPAPISRPRSKLPSPRAATAHDSSTTSWAARNRRQNPPTITGATVTPIGPYRALSSTAAVTALATPPPASRIEAEANCAEPANVVPDITTAANGGNPADRASSPKEIPKPATAMVSGNTARAPPPKLRRGSFGPRRSVFTVDGMVQRANRFARGRGWARPYHGFVLVAAAFLVIGLLLGWGFGGSLRNVAHVRVALWWLFPIGLALQILPLPSFETGSVRYLPFAVLLFSYVLLIAVAAINWRVRGAPLILVGLVLNLIPIALNQGMPVSGSAVREVGGSVASVPIEPGGKHHLATGEDRLTFLGDVIPMRSPFREVVSVGDLVLWLGAAVFLAAAMLALPERPPRPIAPNARRPRPSTMWGSLR